MIFVGIDPGLTGAVAAVDSAGTCTVEDIPTVNLPGDGLIRRRVDGLALARMLRHMVPAGHECVVVIEAVQTMGGKNNAVQTQGSLMRTLGAIESAAEILRMPMKPVLPKVWKKRYGLGSEKGASLKIARELYPVAPLGLAKHHNRAEALLLAHYGKAELA
jgi:crossover junction endodeoxyribonuclease RuvC